MPGSRGRNFRGGDLAEGLGLELLRPIAFVAPVPRPDDVGVDAIGTLFRTEKTRLIAEDSFMVQVKSSSVRQMSFEGIELEWLRKLALPLFWLSVDVSAASVELWPFTAATSHPNIQDLNSITVSLDKVQCELRDEELRISLGSPLLRWTPGDLASIEFRVLLYEILKSAIKFESEALFLRSVGIRPIFTNWKTNLHPPLATNWCVYQGPTEIESTLKKADHIAAALAAIGMTDLHNSQASEAMGLATALSQILNYLQFRGIDVRSQSLIRALAFMANSPQ